MSLSLSFLRESRRVGALTIVGNEPGWTYLGVRENGGHRFGHSGSFVGFGKIDRVTLDLTDEGTLDKVARECADRLESPFVSFAHALHAARVETLCAIISRGTGRYPEGMPDTVPERLAFIAKHLESR